MATSRARRAEAAAKRAKATKLRLAGLPWAEVAEQAGYASAGAACNAVKIALEANLQTQAQSVEDLRRLTIARYDRVQQAFWPAMLQGDKKAADVILKCLEGRSRFEGTVLPQQVEASVTAGVSMAELLDRARAAAEAVGVDIEPESPGEG